MTPYRFVALSLALTSLAVGNARAQDVPTAEAAIDDGDARVVLSLLTQDASVRAGQELHVGVRFVLDPGWHVYYRNPGEAAVGTEITFRSASAQIAPIGWPVPKRLVDPSGTITTFGYEDEVLFVAAATISANASTSVELEAVADFLVCHVECIPGRVTLRRTLPVETTSRPADEATSTMLMRALEAVPRTPAQSGVGVTLGMPPLVPGGVARGAFTIACTDACGFRLSGVRADDVFFPDRITGVETRVIALRETGPRSAIVEVELHANPDDPGADQQLSGVLALPKSGRPLTLEIAGRVPRTRAVAAQDAPVSEADPSLFVILLLAFLGGVILNAMPCVLPVLAMKAFGIIAHAGDARRTRLVHVGAYTVGIVASFWVLAALVIGLRSAGSRVGWGFQLQDPRFVAVLAAVVVLFALRLFGVYAVTVDGTALANEVDRTRGPLRAFGEGVLSVVLATPCSAPFLGTAVGFALTRDGFTIGLVFTVVGLGLAAPFVLLALVPGASRLVPKPGAWMHALEHVLAFVLLATATWLVWVVGTLAGVDGMARALVFALLVAFATFFASRVRARRALVLGLTFVVVAGLGIVTLRGLAIVREAQPTETAWSDEAVRRHLAAGRVVFVDFTASWCITCKANERLVLGSESVRARFEDSYVVTLVGDYTERDPAIASVLERFDKAGVPLYLVYAPSAPERPEVLPELLTTTLVLDAIARAERGPR